MSHYKPYPEYKDSGVEWLGQVPEHWNVVGLSRLLAVPVTDGPHETPEFLTEGIPFLSVDGIQDGELVFDGKRFISEKDHLRYGKKARPKRDDILLGKAASVGKIARVKTDADFNIWSPLALIRVDQRQASPSFVEYSLKSTWLQAQTETKANLNTQFNLGMKDISKLLFCTPTTAEQETIAAHLDRETTRIDALITKKTRFIELLREKRQALITHAVTKGLDPNVKMKDSGVEWLGEVPEHWTLRRLKHLARFTGGGTPSRDNPAYWNGTIPWVSPKDMKTEVISGAEESITAEGLEKSSSSLVPPGHLLMVVRSGILRHTIPVAINSVEVALNQDMKALWLDLSYVSASFLMRYIQGLNDSLLLVWLKQGATVESIEQEDLANTWVPIPPSDEAQKIIEFISRATGRVDALAEKTERSIDLLKERRSSLITAAVTGQIDLREAA